MGSSFSFSSPDKVVASADCNLLLLGAPGQGKSSFVQAVYTLLSGDKERVKANIARLVISSDSSIGTRSVIKFPITNSKLSVVDTGGIGPNDFVKFLLLVMEGSIPDNTEMFGDHSEVKDWDVDRVSMPGLLKRTHAVALFVPGTLTRDSIAFESLRGLVKALNALGTSPLIVINKADLEHPSSLPDLSLPLPAVLETRRGQIAEMLGVQLMDCCFNVAYGGKYSGGERNELIDKATNALLLKLVTRAKNFQETGTAQKIDDLTLSLGLSKEAVKNMRLGDLTQALDDSIKAKRNVLVPGGRRN